jgi:hypothetical protein
MAGPGPSSSLPTSSSAGEAGRILGCIGSRSITGSLFQHWASVAERSENQSGKHHTLSRATLVEEVMGFLISSDWVIGEAQDLHVHVSAAQVRRTFDDARRAEYPKRGEFEAFLKKSGETIADLLFRVELNLLSTRIQARVLAGERTQQAKEHALAHFVSEFTKRWRAQTYCAPAYQVSDCGHVQAVL